MVGVRVVLGLSCERPLVFGSGSVEVKQDVLVLSSSGQSLIVTAALHNHKRICTVICTADPLPWSGGIIEKSLDYHTTLHVAT